MPPRSRVSSFSVSARRISFIRCWAMAADHRCELNAQAFGCRGEPFLLTCQNRPHSRSRTAASISSNVLIWASSLFKSSTAAASSTGGWLRLSSVAVIRRARSRRSSSVLADGMVSTSSLIAGSMTSSPRSAIARVTATIFCRSMSSVTTTELVRGTPCCPRSPARPISSRRIAWAERLRLWASRSSTVAQCRTRWASSACAAPRPPGSPAITVAVVRLLMASSRDCGEGRSSSSAPTAPRTRYRREFSLGGEGLRDVPGRFKSLDHPPT